MERKKPMGKRVTLADIAKVAGVTPATVQRALKGLEGVGDEQRQNILRVAKEMNYRPNVLASTLKKGEVNIAIVLPDAEDEISITRPACGTGYRPCWTAPTDTW